MNTKQRVQKYVKDWKRRGYPNGIPDEVPQELMKLGLAPSYKAICLALLNNDINLYTLGFSRPKSEWYGKLKRIEIDARQ
jgi:predicted phosphoadenosine phosphosulfate sulfurtransferase